MVRPLVSGSHPTATTPQTPCSLARVTTPRVSSKAGSCRWQWLSMIIVSPGRPAPASWSDAPLRACDYHAPNHERRRGGAIPKHQVTAHGLDVLPHLEQVAGHRDLLDGIGQLALVDPHADGAARIISGDAVDTE